MHQYPLSSSRPTARHARPLIYAQADTHTSAPMTRSRGRDQTAASPAPGQGPRRSERVQGRPPEQQQSISNQDERTVDNIAHSSYGRNPTMPQPHADLHRGVTRLQTPRGRAHKGSPTGRPRAAVLSLNFADPTSYDVPPCTPHRGRERCTGRTGRLAPRHREILASPSPLQYVCCVAWMRCKSMQREPVHTRGMGLIEQPATQTTACDGPVSTQLRDGACPSECREELPSQRTSLTASNGGSQSRR